MQRKALLALAALAVVGLVCIWVLAFSGSGAPAITVRLVKSIRSGRAVTATFEITNHTSNVYFISPERVEVRNGARWQQSDDQFCLIGMDILPERSCLVSTYVVTNLPTGAALRLALTAEQKFCGFNGFVKRLKLRFPRRGISLNPFDQSNNLPWDEVVSEAFTLPPP